MDVVLSASIKQKKRSVQVPPSLLHFFMHEMITIKFYILSCYPGRARGSSEGIEEEFSFQSKSNA